MGSSNDTPSHNYQQQSGSEGRATSTSTSEVQSPHPPASNPGADDPTAGISEGAGGLSNTAYIESPVGNNEPSLLSTVKNMLGFGAGDEIKAEDKEPAENATTAPASSILAGSAVAGSAAAATTSSTSSSGPTAYSSSGPATSVSDSSTTGAGKGTYLSYQGATNEDTAASSSSQTLPIRSTPGGSLASATTSTARTDTASNTTESIDRTASNTNVVDDTKNNNDNLTGSGSTDDTKERDEPSEHKPPVPADGKPTGGKGLENRDAIPTAGGKRLGEEHWGESGIVPDDPKRAAEKQAASSADGMFVLLVRDERG